MTKIDELMALVADNFQATEYNAHSKLRTALEAALKQGEPVAWQVHPFDYGIGPEGVYARTSLPEQVAAWERKGWTVQPLYTSPLRREPLTDEQPPCNPHPDAPHGFNRNDH